MFILKSLRKLEFRESGKISLHAQNNLQIFWDTEPANDHRGETWSPFLREMRCGGNLMWSDGGLKRLLHRWGVSVVLLPTEAENWTKGPSSRQPQPPEVSMAFSPQDSQDS